MLKKLSDVVTYGEKQEPGTNPPISWKCTIMKVVVLWSGLVLDGRTDLHIFQRSTLTALRYRIESLDLYSIVQRCSLSLVNFYG